MGWWNKKETVAEKLFTAEVLRVQEIVEEQIGEPVKSILRSLEEGWWSFKRGGYTSDLLEFKHEWFGTEMSVTTYLSYQKKLGYKAYCNENWMNDVEKYTVGEMCENIANGVQYAITQSKKKNRREEFMCLTKEI